TDAYRSPHNLIAACEYRGNPHSPEGADPAGVANILREILVPLVSAIVSSKTSQEALRPEHRPQPRSRDQTPSPGERKYCEARVLAERLVQWSMPGPNGTVK